MAVQCGSLQRIARPDPRERPEAMTAMLCSSLHNLALRQVTWSLSAQCQPSQYNTPCCIRPTHLQAPSNAPNRSPLSSGLAHRLRASQSSFAAETRICAECQRQVGMLYAKAYTCNKMYPPCIIATFSAGNLPAELPSHMWQAQDTQGDTLTLYNDLAMINDAS